MRVNTSTNNKAFSLLEMTVVVIILTILASAAIPVMSRAFFEKAGTKTALDMSAIEEAARAYYVDNNRWPDNSNYSSPIAALQAGNYLPQSWRVINPFKYSYNASSNGSTFTVSTYLPKDGEGIVQNLLPSSWSNGNYVYSSIPVPGVLSVMPSGAILAWASGTIPTGFLLCDGSVYNIASYPALAGILGSAYGGDGVNTFAVPNLQGRTIFGYLASDSNFGILGNTGGSVSMVGNGRWSRGHADTANWYNQVKISGDSLYGMTGAQTAQGVSTAVLNPYMTLNYIIKT